MINATEVRNGFKRRMPGAGEPRLFRAPGRVNLIGEHTDYNEGFVMPAAIEFSTIAAVSARTDSKVHVYSKTLDQAFEFDLDDPAPKPVDGWSDYVAGTAYSLRDGGAKLRGANLLIDSDVPLGSGLSSSAAIEVSAAYALLAIAGVAMEPIQIALACQRAENQFVGVRSGIMDQFASCFGALGHALMLDCRSLGHQELPLPPNVSLVICNTMVKHELAGGEYNQRRADCEEGAKTLGIRALRDITVEEFADRGKVLPERIFRRCRHVVTENARVEEAAQALRSHDCAVFGELMNESHASLDQDYEVTCPELNVMVELARQVSGVYGARMTGGGFGGCTINLVQTDAVERFHQMVAKGYQERTGLTPEIYVTAASQGATEVFPT
ncbi:MAG: galactokinase [Bryobacterales bacterium]|nr:galactokinase [Bryobacterales bacterium]